jgi:hypothetical protein
MLETVMLNPEIAETDIVCYKVVQSQPGNHVKSNVMGYVYEVGTLNTEIDVHVERKIFTDVDNSLFLIVNEGYHSYQKLDDIASVSEEQHIRECIVPKGSRIFVDVYHKQMVSSNIIITEKIVEKK